MNLDRVYVCAELGINGNGDPAVYHRMIDAAADCGASAVKLQRRTIDRVYTAAEQAAPRPGPWGATNGEQKRWLELPLEALASLRDHASSRGLDFTASPWDEEALRDLVSLGVPWIKIPSPRLGHTRLLDAAARSGLPIVLSCGMSTLDEVRAAVRTLGPSLAVLCHCVSAYPQPAALIRYSRLAHVETIAGLHGVALGYSGHEAGSFATLYAVARCGARFVERHLTLDRTMAGSDQSASIEPGELASLIREIRAIEADTSTDVAPSEVHPIEAASRAKLWRTEDLT